METDNHQLISDLAVHYADQMCGGNPEKKFDRRSIAAAYIIGAEEVLHRVQATIMTIVRIGAPGCITKEQGEKLLRTIEGIEALSSESYSIPAT